MIEIKFSADELQAIRNQVREANGLTYQDDPDCTKWVIPTRAKYQARDQVYSETGRVPRLTLMRSEFSADGYVADFEMTGWHETKGAS